MAGIISKSTGVEEVLDAVETVLIRDINDALDEVYQRQAPADIARAARREVEYVPIEYEYVPPDHFKAGNFPSLALDDVPRDAYPYIVLTTETYTPNAEGGLLDEVNVYNDAVVVHCLAASSEEEGSELAFRRSVRMGEAVFISLMSSELARRLDASNNPIRGQQSIPWRGQFEGHGDNWWFQSCGTFYSVKTYTTQYD